MAVVGVRGLSEVTRLLRRLGDDMEDLKDANARLSGDIAQRASAIAPRLTGALASSIRGNRAQKKLQIKAGNARVPYAGVIEFGWPSRRIEAQPYLRRAAFREKDLIKQRYEDNIEQIIRKYDFDPI